MAQIHRLDRLGPSVFCFMTVQRIKPVGDGLIERCLRHEFESLLASKTVRSENCASLWKNHLSAGMLNFFKVSFLRSLSASFSSEWIFHHQVLTGN
jgi:hypothetical protein